MLSQITQIRDFVLGLKHADYADYTDLVFIQIRSKKAPTDYTDSTDKRFCIRIKARR